MEFSSRLLRPGIDKKGNVMPSLKQKLKHVHSSGGVWGAHAPCQELEGAHGALHLAGIWRMCPEDECIAKVRRVMQGFWARRAASVIVLGG